MTTNDTVPLIATLLPNRQLAPDIETIFLPTNEENFYVSSSLVREVGMMGGDISRLVPRAVLQTLKKKFNKKP